MIHCNIAKNTKFTKGQKKKSLRKPLNIDLEGNDGRKRGAQRQIR